VAREIREETGLDASVERPLEVVEFEQVHGDDAVQGYFVVFEALADDSGFGDDLGEKDDLGENDTEIEEAAWFAEIPEDCEDEERLCRHF
jgi:8-oxo-dGTP pyrophosphatase MutT (NUDIX family)